MRDIRLERVEKSWGATHAVRDLSFSVAAGEFLVLLGPSGCGKSTTLRMIAGLEDVSGGRILIGGRDVTAEPPSRRGLSMVFQSYALFPHLSVAENIVFGLKVRKVDRAARALRLRQVAAMVGLEELLDRKPAQLSGGQRQRVALARAIAAEHPVCLMDEPLSNLDARLRQDMRAEIRGLQQRLGMTVVYVTHDQIEAMSMADRVILLRDGRLEQEGTPEEIYARPASDFVARFIGVPPMNLIRLDDGPHGAVISGCGGTLPPVMPGRGSGYVLGVRPEDVRLGDAGFFGRVEALDYHGADTVVAVRLGDQLVQARVPGRAAVRPGEVVRVAWPSAATHLFAADGGRRCAEVPPIEEGNRQCSAD